ncbi:MAG: hypothetical protein WC522_01975 [Candidatus Omnitrophota bacterium]
MKYLCIAVAVIFIFGIFAVGLDKAMAGSGACDGAGKTAKEEQAPVAAEGADEPVADDEEDGVGSRRAMPTMQTYDQNTGLPNLVSSDREGEIE